MIILAVLRNQIDFLLNYCNSIILLLRIEIVTIVLYKKLNNPNLIVIIQSFSHSIASLLNSNFNEILFNTLQ